MLVLYLIVAVGTELVDTYFLEKKFMTRRSSTFTQYCSVKLSSIVENLLLLSPVGVWVVSQSQLIILSDQLLIIVFVKK
ncbi:hypothetical protein CR513_26035, partial [Mucuna pruriens]